MDEDEAARKILDCLKGNKQIITLRNLAEVSGFRGVNSDFKKGFNYLQKHGIVKLRQPGWPSEQRGKKDNHPKSVILLADVYVVEDAEKEIREKETGVDCITAQIKQYRFQYTPVNALSLLTLPPSGSSVIWLMLPNSRLLVLMRKNAGSITTAAAITAIKTTAIAAYVPL
jgi:hypothetical protein